MTVPTTIYVWLFLLIVTFLAPAVVPQDERRVSSGREATLSAPEFAELADAETKARSAFGIDASQRKLRSLGGLGGLGSLGSLTGNSASQRDSLLGDAAKTFRSLEKSLHTPGLVRRVLVVEHAQGKPLDNTLLTKDLPNALKEDGQNAGRIAEEQRLWRGIYGDPPSVSRLDVAGDARLVQGMNLRFLKNRVLADLYTAAGDKPQAAVYQDAFDQAMLKSAAAEAGLGFYLLVVILVGVAGFLLFAIAARTGRWQMVRRTPTHPQVLGWGDLLDAFVFYLAFVKAIGLGIGALTVRLLPDPTPSMALSIESAVYVGTGVLALFYLLATARRRGVTLSDIGLRAPRGLLPEIGYGFLGYCAALPLVFSLGLLSHVVFRHDQTRTPNPILPLIAVENNPVGRIVIYLLVAVAAPFFEELFFRGALFSGLRTRYGWVLTAVLSGAAFAVVHPMQDWLPIFGLGFALATMREMRQSLIPGMTAHFLQNTLAFISMSVLFGS